LLFLSGCPSSVDNRQPRGSRPARKPGVRRPCGRCGSGPARVAAPTSVYCLTSAPADLVGAWWDRSRARAFRAAGAGDRPASRRARREKPQPRQGGGLEGGLAANNSRLGPRARVAQRTETKDSKSGLVRAALCSALSLSKSETVDRVSARPAETGPKRTSSTSSRPSSRPSCRPSCRPF
jgi:hypothetical protein